MRRQNNTSSYSAEHKAQINSKWCERYRQMAFSYKEALLLKRRRLSGHSAAETGHPNGSAIVDELKGQHTILKDCIAQLTTVESSRANLISHRREVLLEQEYKLDQVRNQLQAAQSHADQAGSICRQLLNGHSNGQNLAEQNRKEVSTSQTSTTFISGNLRKFCSGEVHSTGGGPGLEMYNVPEQGQADAYMIQGTEPVQIATPLLQNFETMYNEGAPEFVVDQGLYYPTI